MNERKSGNERAEQIAEAIVDLINKYWIELDIQEAYTFDTVAGFATSICVADKGGIDYDWDLIGDKQ